jgi:hypothetical protein
VEREAFHINFLRLRFLQQAKHLAASAFNFGLVADSGPFHLRESVRIFVHTKIWTRRGLMILILGRASFTLGTTIWAKNIYFKLVPRGHLLPSSKYSPR